LICIKETPEGKYNIRNAGNILPGEEFLTLLVVVSTLNMALKPLSGAIWGITLDF